MHGYYKWQLATLVLVVAAAVLILSIAFCDKAHSFTLVRVQTKAGPIIVNADHAHQLAGFINALPYIPRHVSCYARYGHVRFSLHHIGGACDIDQRGRNSTSHVMYHVAALAASFRLRSGCSFRDCGHVDIGFAHHRASRITTAHHRSPRIIVAHHRRQHEQTTAHRHLT